MVQREQRLFLAVCGTTIALAVLGALWMGLADLPCPRGVDDAFYKSPAAELVQTGRLSQPSVVGYLPRAEEVFAAYPPLYQLVVAGWFELFGVSTGSSVAFGHVVHLLNMVALMALVATALAPQSMPWALRALAVSAAGLLFFGILRFFDRQEELAVLFCWAEALLSLRGRLRGYRGAALSGGLIGLSGMVSPWTGLVFAVLVSVRELLELSRLTEAPLSRRLQRAAARLVLAGAVALVPVIAWLGWLEWTHPRIITEQFLVHLRISERTTIWEAPEKAVTSLLYSPYQLPALLFTLVYFPLLLRRSAGPNFPAPHPPSPPYQGGARGGGARGEDKRKRQTVPPVILALFGTGVSSLVFTLVCRANSYNYVWLCLFLLIPCFGYLAGRLLAEAGPRERVFPVLLVVLCAGVSLRDPVSLSLIAHDLPSEERLGPIFTRLAAQVPPDETVATTSRYWYLFQGRNPWRLTAIYPHLSEQQRRVWVRWIVLPLEHATEEEQRELLRGFELVTRVPSTYQTWAPSFHQQDRTWAYELYRRQDEK